MKQSPIWLWITIIVSTACAKESSIKPAQRGELITHEQKVNLTVNEVVDRITELDAVAFAEHGVKCYTITYRTIYGGEPIDSRGLLLVPENVDSAYLVMYCHGTEIPSEALGIEDKTPSTYTGSNDTHLDVRTMGLSWAAAGYVVFFPDYIGYGATLGEDHPYLNYHEMFPSNIDGLLAVKEFLGKHTTLQYDNRLFLSGWSQGAGAALSAHRYIQEGYGTEFNVVATSGLAGPYNYARMVDEILMNDSKECTIMPIVSWSIYSINKFSGIRRPTDQLYSYPVFNQLASISVPSNIPNQVFKDYFIGKLKDGSDLAFWTEINNNSFHTGWLPTGKVFLHHGDADAVVPYYNSQDALVALTAEGADIHLYTYPGGDHATELANFTLGTLNDFNLLK